MSSPEALVKDQSDVFIRTYSKSEKFTDFQLKKIELTFFTELRRCSGKGIFEPCGLDIVDFFLLLYWRLHHATPPPPPPRYWTMSSKTLAYLDATTTTNTQKKLNFRTCFREKIFYVEVSIENAREVNVN